MISKVWFLALFLAGLGLAVYSMLHGVERSRASAGRRPSAIFNAPVVSVCATVLGAAGYLLVTRSRLGITTILILATIMASAATTGTAIVLARWAFPFSGNCSDDDAIQGLLALVTRAISPAEPGEISFQKNGKQHVLAAESIQGAEIPRDAEVVIDAIHNGVARVEPWSAVEQRL